MEQRTRDLISGVSFLAFAAFFLFAAVNLDVFCAGRARLIVTLVIALCGIPMVMSARFWRHRWKTGTCAACWLLALALFLTPWHPRKRFFQRLESIRQGMAVDEVEAVMGRYIRSTGANWQNPDGTIIYRWNDDDWQFDADVGFVEFVNGRVVHVEFLSD